MLNYLIEFMGETWTVLLELSPALLLGLTIAGLLHAFLPSGIVKRHMSQSNLGSVLRAVLIGIPMPLCSCGVVPTTLGLRQDGASPGAATGFLISTPQTGVDSILVSASFLGWPFALFKVLAAFITGMLGGWLVNATEPKGFEAAHDAVPSLETEGVSSTFADQKLSFPARLLESLRYGIDDILGAINTYLVIGVLLAAALNVMLPDGYFSDVAWVQGIGGMLLVLLIATPLYICTTSSVPVAAALVAAGMPIGTALVFLMAGPATNVTTLVLIWRSMGKRVTLIYLGVVVVMSVVLGYAFSLFFSLTTPSQAMMTHVHMNWVNTVSAVLLVGLSVFLFGRNFYRRHFPNKEVFMSEKDKVLKVGGMTCNHCTATVKRTLEADPTVDEATPDLATGNVIVRGDNLNIAELAKKIREIGYTCEVQ
jgi:uncharacterized membrane protein YraQ (UPF0718 family)/copper chaperone CopZ